MKRLVLLFFLAFLWGCEKPNGIVDPNTNLDEIYQDDSNIIAELPEVLHGYVVNDNGQESNDTTLTRTFLHNDKEVLWHNGDAISYYLSFAHNVKYMYNGEDGAASADFEYVQGTGYEGAGLQKSYAVYPYSENNAFIIEDDVETLNVNYPTEQNYSVNSFGKGSNIMISTGEGEDIENLYFRNACGYLVIKLWSPVNKVKSISLRTNDESIKLSGNASVVLDEEGIPCTTMSKDSKNYVNLVCPDVALGTGIENATEFWFALPPVEIVGGITIEVTDVEDHTYTKSTNKTINIVRNEIQPMAAFEIDWDRSQLQIRYTTSDDLPAFNTTGDLFDIPVLNHDVDEEKGDIVISFETPPTTIRANVWKESKITSITLPSSITTIEDEAFMSTPLTSVTLGDGLMRIGTNAFKNTQISELNLPESLTTIGQGAFMNTPLESITIPGNVTSVGVDAFYNCTDLTSVTFKANESDEELKIGYCIHLSDTKGPFYYSPLTSINLNREIVLTDDEGNAFESDDWAEGLFATLYYNDEEKVPAVSLTIGPKVNKLQKYMFNWLAITSITIPANVTIIDEFAFDNCSKLSTVIIEESNNDLKIIGDSPFYESPLTSISYNRPVRNYNSSLNLITPNSSQGIFAINSDFMDEISTTLTIGDNITVIPEYMFAYLPITEVTIKTPVYHIANNAFIGCEKLATIDIKPDSDPIRIGYQLYASQEYGPFYDSPLTKIKLGREVTYGLAHDSIDGWEEGLFAHKHYDTKDFPTVDVTLSSNVRTISKFMFARLPIESITIPGTIQSVAEYAFDDCARLNTVCFGYNRIPLVIKGQGTDGGGDDFDNGPFFDSPLESISFDRHFDYQGIDGTAYTADIEDKGLFAINPEILEVNTELTTTVSIGANVTTIPEYMFAYVPMTSITIPANVTEIKHYAFEDCTKLTSIKFSPSTESLIMGYQPGNDETGPFFESPLTSIDLNREIVYYNSFNPDEWNEGVFSNQFNTDNETGHRIPVSVTLGNNVKTLSAYMFARLGLESLTIPSSVTKIADGVFEDNTLLTSVTFSSGTTDLEIGFQSGTSQVGAFYQSPLEIVNLDRNLKLSNRYSSSLDSTNEGVFSSSYYNDANYPNTVVTLGNNVKTIHDYMFAESRISTLAIPSSTTSIEKYAFGNCKRLSLISIPGTVASVGLNAFIYCSALSSVTIEEGNTALSFTCQYYNNEEWAPFYDSPLENISLKRDIAYKDSEGAAYVPDEWEEGFFANKHYDDIEEVSVTLGGRVTTLNEYMFNYLPIKTLTIPSCVKLIEVNAFQYCSDITSVNIMPGVNKDDILSICPQITTILGIPSQWGAFYDSKLTSITLDRNMFYSTRSGSGFVPTEANEGIFSNSYEGVTSVNIGMAEGTSLTEIPENAFRGVYVKNIWIPKHITVIGNYAFKDCPIFEGLSCNHTTPPRMGYGAFANCPNMWYIRVPEEAMDAFKSMDPVYSWGIYNTTNSKGENYYYAL